MPEGGRRSRDIREDWSGMKTWHVRIFANKCCIRASESRVCLMEELRSEQSILTARKLTLPQPYSGPIPTRDHKKVVLEPKSVISENLEKTI